LRNLLAYLPLLLIERGIHGLDPGCCIAVQIPRASAASFLLPPTNGLTSCSATITFFVDKFKAAAQQENSRRYFPFVLTSTPMQPDENVTIAISISYNIRLAKNRRFAKRPSLLLKK
jgi:hypothetical protein